MNEDLDKIEKFLPREFPKKEPIKFDKVKARKQTLFLLSITVFGSILLWLMGNQTISENQTSTIKPSPSVALPSTSLRITQTPTSKVSEVIEEIDLLTKDLKGTYGAYVYNLTTKESFGIKENQVFGAASLMKLPVILSIYYEAEAGRINLETKYTLKASDKRSGAGSMFYKPAGTVYTYQKMIELMGQQSDNTAFNVFRNLLGDAKIQNNIDDLGMKNTSIERFDTSPEDVGLFIRKLYSGSIISRAHRDQILGYLTNTFDESRIPAGVPAGTQVAHKVGTDVGISSDGGIVFAKKPYVVVIMSKDNLLSQAQEVLPKISKAIWEFENEN